jgi:hypothetical protein
MKTARWTLTLTTPEACFVKEVLMNILPDRINDLEKGDTSSLSFEQAKNLLKKVQKL